MVSTADAATKPHILCVPGSWLSPSIWDPTLSRVRAAGFHAETITLPTVGAEPALDSFDEDVSAIAAKLKGWIEGDGRDVLLVLHSFNGVTGSEACRGLGKREREQQGLKGGVVHIVYVAGLILPEGGTAKTEDNEWPDWMTVDDTGRKITVTHDDAKKVFFNDMDAAAAEPYCQSLQHQSIAVYSSPVTYCAWKQIPTSYAVGDQDMTHFRPELVRMLLGMARSMEPTAFANEFWKEGAGHCLMISQPDWLSKIIIDAAA